MSQVVGWGNDGSGKLQLVHMPVVSQVTCLRSKGDFYNRVTSDYTFCAGMRNGEALLNHIYKIYSMFLKL